MKRGGPLARNTPMKRVPMVRKPRRPASKGGSDFPPAVREAIEWRSGGWCEAGTPKCRGHAHHIHHILRRGQGGKGTETNGLHVCEPCHLHIHSHIPEAIERGWLRRSGGDT